MPPQSRSQRRRQNARRQPRPAASTEMMSRAPSIGTPVDSEEIEELAAVASPPSRPAPSQPARAASRRRVLSRSAPEPIDYTKDYRDVRRDLRWILLWTVLLLGAMIVLKFSGIV